MTLTYSDAGRLNTINIKDMKFKWIHFFYVIFVSMALGSCADSPTSSTEDAIGETTEAVGEEPSAEHQTISDVVGGYLRLKDALVDSNPTQAKERAVELLELIDATQMINLQQNAKQIAATEDLENQRVYFDSLSVNLYQKVKETKSNEQILYKQYCPMAFNNRGAFWLSSSEEIRNPYYGAQMMHCGNTEETIEPSTDTP